MTDISVITAADRTSVIRALFVEKREEVACGLVVLALKVEVATDTLLEACDRIEADWEKGACDAVEWVREKLGAGRYVSAEEVEDDDEAFADKMQKLTAQLGEQMAKGAELDHLIRQKLGGLGYEF